MRPAEFEDRDRRHGYATAGLYRALIAGAVALLLLALGAPVLAQAHRDQGESDVVELLDDNADRPWAQGIPLAIRQQAYRIFLDGNELMKEALFAKGADKYRAALELWDHPAFHYNLGVAQMNLDQIIEAYGSFERARHHGPRPIGQDKYELAQYYLNLLRNQLAEIEIVCDEPEAAVALDGKPLFIAPGRQRVMVRPGGHRVEATKTRREPDIQQVVLDPGDEKRVTLKLEFPEYLATVRYWPQWIPWAVAGSGAALLLGGGALGLRSAAAINDFDSRFDKQCSGPEGCLASEVPGELRDQLDQATIEQNLARGITLAGGLTLATSAVLLYLNRERIVRRRGLVEASQVSFTPVVSPNAAGVSARLRF